VRDERRSDAATLLAELGLTPKLTIYLGGAPGAGKTHRLLTDALGEAKAGRRVAIGWIETKHRPQLEALAAPLPRIPPRRFPAGGSAAIADFDLDAALASDYETIVLDELAHANPAGAAHAKRWQDALALRAAGKSVLGAFNVMHLDTVAPVAERITGFPIRELVPIAFLRKADRVIALDVAPSILESRLRTGRIVRDEDVERAAAGLFQPQNLAMMRELLLRVVDDLTVPVVAPSKVSIALAAVTGATEVEHFVRRAAAFADALDLALETTGLEGVERERLAAATLQADGGVVPVPPGLGRGDLREVRASLLIVPRGPLAGRILERPLDRDLLIADPGAISLTALERGRHPYGFVLGDRLRIGYGKLTIYLGSVAGSGKTYAMLDRAHQLAEDGADVVAALVETHGRPDTIAQLAGIEQIPRLANGEMDLETLLLRRPQVALIDELAHTNLSAGARAKRYDDVIAVLRSGIDVLTTLNVQHLAGVGDAVERLTGTRVRETLPDSVLEFADEVIFVDVTPDVLRQRLREGKIYPKERIDAALSHFFRTENLAALRELAVREVLRARSERRRERPFARIVLGVAPRERDAELIARAGRLAQRLDVDLRVACVVPSDGPHAREVVDALARATAAARGTFVADVAPDAAAGIVASLAGGDVLAVESPRVPRRRFFGKPSFAVRVLAAGARELLVLAPRDARAAAPEDGAQK
jgi:two-component system, OmpR family, sensor histidine kinase KdpD